MKTITKEITLLEKSDLVNAVSKLSGKTVELKEMEVYLAVLMPLDKTEYGDFSDCGVYCSISVNGKDVDIYAENSPIAEFFYNCEFYRTDEEIFAFDTNEFGSYCRTVDTSD